MKEFVEKLIGRLEEIDRKTFRISPKDAIEIVNQLAEEYINCSTNISTDKSTTNAERIRNMSDEELADFLEEFEACDVCKYLDNNRCTFENPCVHDFAGAMIYDWLQSEVKGSDV